MTYLLLDVKELFFVMNMHDMFATGRKVNFPRHKYA